MIETQVQPQETNPREQNGYGALVSFCQQIYTFRNQEELLRAVVQTIPKVVHSQGGAILLPDRDNGKMAIVAVEVGDADIDACLKSVHYPNDPQSWGRLFQSNAATIVRNFNDALCAPHLMDHRLCALLDKSIVVRLPTSGETMGLLLALNKSERPFDRRHEEGLCALASVTAVAMAALSRRQQLTPSDPQVEEFNFAKDRVIHHLSHALKTPLAVLIASLKLLAKHLNRLPDSAWQTVYQRAQRNLERLLSIEYETEDILGQRENGLAESKGMRAEPAPEPHQPNNGTNDFFHHVNIEFLVHELKDPVGIVESGVRMLLEKPEPSLTWTPTQQRTLQRVLRNVHKTREMLNELLEVGRAQSVCFHCRPFQPLEALKKIVVEVVELNDPELFEEMKGLPNEADRLAFLAHKGIRLDVAPAAEALTVEQDEVKFSQVVGNLIKNGFYYRRRHLLIHLACQRDHFSVSVRDDGPGIAPIHQEEIFERYKQVAPCAGMARTGHGLGLAMARILARTMGGDIGVESELGQGALFCLSLPSKGLQKS